MVSNLQIGEQIVDVKILQTQGVNPHSENALLSAVPDVVDFQGRKINLNAI